jgi:uncharacterized protein
MSWKLFVGALTLSVAPWSLGQGVVISQVYGGGGNSGATYTHDFVEIFNASSQPVSLVGWSVQYASAAGSSWSVSPLAGTTLQPGQYHLVQQSAGAGGTTPLPAPDSLGSLMLSATAGKVALVQGTAALTGTAPSGPAVLDFVGYGSANHFEGSAPAPALSNTTAALRARAGCQDSGDNLGDFTAAAPNPRNGAVPATPCSAPVSAPIVPSCPVLSLAQGAGGHGEASASDADGIVVAGQVQGTLPAGVSLGGFTPATGVGGTAGLRLEVAPGTAAGSYPIALRWANNQGQTADCTLLINVASLTRIPGIQGTGATSPLVGLTVTTEGVVTHLTNNGFFLQDPVGDGNPATSDGIFVFTGTAATAPRPAVGRLVRLTGTVAEFNTGAATNAQTAANPVTQLTNVQGVQVVRDGVSISPTTLDLPAQGGAGLERYEGMLVRVPGPVTVSQNFFLGRYGQLTMSVGGRLETPTNRYRPGPQAQALSQENARRSFILDDSTTAQNPNPIPYIGADNTVRAGDTVDAVVGVVDYGLATASNTGLASYRIHPTVPPRFTRAHPRTQAPEPVGGNVRVASFNVLNFFTTFTDGRTADGESGQGCRLGDAVAASNCRGASNLAEYLRQRDKIVAALAAVDADVVGLIEIQNNGDVALRHLVDALNARVGAGVYAAVPQAEAGAGTDAIKLAFLYKPARVSLAGPALIDADPVHNRPPLGQAFAAANGERFAVIVNHFKSKSCGDATGAEADQGDLQGCWNALRVRQAQALADFAEALQVAGDTEDVLVIGDLNAYAQEDPVHELTQRGWVDEVGRYNRFGYGYVFDGAAGRLDHALASPSLSPKVTGATEWHINADEPSVIDYNLEFKPQDLYSPTPYRSSDHDPVVVGLQLYRTIQGSRRPEKVQGTPGDDILIGGKGPDRIWGGAGADVFVYRSVLDGPDVIHDFEPAHDRLDLRALFPAAGADPFASGQARLHPTGAGAILKVRRDTSPRGAWLPLVLLKGVPARDFDPRRHLVH